MRRLSLILILALLAGAILGALAEDVVLFSEPAEESVGGAESELLSGAAEEPPAETDIPAAVPNYTPRNLVRFVSPKNGETVAPGKVALRWVYDPAGIYDDAGQMIMDQREYIGRYMPTTLAVTKVGRTEVTSVVSERLDFAEGTQYAAVRLNDEGTYTLSVCTPDGASAPDTITINVRNGAASADPENPGYFIIPEKTEYTINLAVRDTQRVPCRLSCCEYVEGAGYILGDDETGVVETVNWKEKGQPYNIQLTQEGDRYVYDTWVEYRGLKVGAAKVTVSFILNGRGYDERTITFHVIDEPAASPAPSASPQPEDSDPPPIAPTKVKLNRTRATLGVKETLRLTAKLTPANADTWLIWSSDKPKVASVDKNGVVTGKKAGTAKITVTADNGGRKATCTVTVKAAPKKVTLNKKGTVTLKKGKTLKLKATLPKNTASALTWESSNPDVAAVDQNGKVTASKKKKGAATITVRTFNKKKASVKIRVK